MERPYYGTVWILQLAALADTRSTTTIIMYIYRIALRSRVPRSAIRYHNVHARTLTSTTGYSPSPNQSQPPRPKTGGDRNGLYIGGGLAAIGALWYYFAVTDRTRIERERTGPEPHAQLAIDDATRLARDSAQSADASYQDVKAVAQSKVQGAREQASSGIESGKQRFEEGKDQIGHHISEARTAAEKRVDAAKTGWWNWFSWGRSQTQEAADELKRRASETQEAWNARFEEAKKKAEQKGENIMQRAGETEEDFRRRIAKAIGRV
ncbi:hypothetical protein BJY52DRAFT_1292036 [Lactarius psammicola]|nr:hypothetical protein BJY52DRAFT_1292036 [Lactarius psammicola]